MLHACVQKLDVTGTVKKYWKLNAGSCKEQCSLAALQRLSGSRCSFCFSLQLIIMPRRPALEWSGVEWRGHVPEGRR